MYCKYCSTRLDVHDANFLAMHPPTITEYGAINLEELCLERLSSWLKSGDEVDRLPLPIRLKDKLKWYFDK